jgi:hypothetical protein
MGVRFLVVAAKVLFLKYKQNPGFIIHGVIDAEKNHNK